MEPRLKKDAPFRAWFPSAGGKKFFFVGINGIGVSSVAILLHKMGYFVCGSCDRPNRVSAVLIDMGIEVIFGHFAQSVAGFDYVVFGSAIKGDNPELVEAKKLGIEVVHRSEALGCLMQRFVSFGVMGSHGKTTVSGFVSTVAVEAGLAVNASVGGILPKFGWNGVFDKDADKIVVEVDESDGSFVNMPYDAVLLNNISPEHLAAYDGDLLVMVDRILSFFRNNRKGPARIALCIDDPLIEEKFLQEVVAIVEDSGGELVTYGLRHDAQVRAVDVKQGADGLCFGVVCGNGIDGFGGFGGASGASPCVVNVPLYGLHNVGNVLGGLCLLGFMGVGLDVSTGLAGCFDGVDRRFSVIHRSSDLVVIDDYAHHHKEVNAFLKGLKHYANSNGFGRVVCVFQPHRYTRLDGCMEDYSAAFDQLDVLGQDCVLVAPVYAAGEEKIDGVDSVALVGVAGGLKDFSRTYGCDDAHFGDAGVASVASVACGGDCGGSVDEVVKKLIFALSDDEFANVGDLLKKFVRKGDLVAFVGAGSVSDVARRIDFDSFFK